MSAARATPGSANREAKVGPNAIIQLAAALRAAGGEAAAARVFAAAGLLPLLAAPPGDMVDQRVAGRLHDALRGTMPGDAAGRIALDAGRRTADYLLAHRIPAPARWLMRALPPRPAARVLLRAMTANAWTYAGTGRVRATAGDPCVLEIVDNPLAQPGGCPWHRGVFERLFRALVFPAARLHHISCCADGAPRLSIRDYADPEDRLMDPLFARYARRATPRYTSYPTAPHFQKGFPEERYRDWLARLDPSAPVSLYLHVPFCRKMCWYCGCNMKLAARYEPVADYAEVLRREVALTADALPGRTTVSHLHWGGGTPTALEPEDLARIMDDVRARWDFAGDAEVAIESDPRTLTAPMAARIGAMGFTRASFGVQEFDARVQAAINRVQPPDMVARAVARLRGAGVLGINFDLIYGLPHQTVASLVETVRLCAAMRPDRVALFGYAHVPWMAKNQRMIDEAVLPGAAARAAQAEAAAEALAAEDYVAIGLDHFALPQDGLAVAARAGRLRRNFQGYTTDQARTLIGMGATSIGRTPSGYVQNIAETGAWARAVAGGRLPVAKGLPFTDDDRLRAEVIERLMCDGRVDAAAIGRAHGAPEGWWAAAFDTLEEMAADGLLSLSDGEVRMTAYGRPLVRVAAAAFDAHFRAGAARHSVAV